MENSTTDSVLKLHRPPFGFGVWAATCIVVLSFLYIWWKNHPLYGRNRGAKVYPLVGNFVQVLWNIRTVYDYTVRLMREQGTLTLRWVMPGNLTTHLTANPENVEYILKTNFENYPKGEYFQDTLRDYLGNGILNTDGDLWRMQRKIASFEFTTRSLRNFMMENEQEGIDGRLIPILSRACDLEQTVDLQDILKRFNFDSICRLSFGVDPGCLSDPSLPNLEFYQAFDVAAAVSSTRFSNVTHWKLMRALNIGSERRLHGAVACIRNYLMSVIHERRKEILQTGVDKSHRVDLLSRFMDHGNEESEKLSDEFLCDMLVSFLQAGRDTVATALSWFFLRLTRNRQVEDTIRAEIDGIRRARSSTKDGADQRRTQFSYQELKSMHYLQAAIFEAMRMDAPVPCDLKVTENDDVWPDGTRVRKGEIVGYHPYAMGRMEALWGPDCFEYRPERWLKDGVFVPENPYKFPVFQAGPRICLGKDMGIMQAKLIAAAILDQFTFSVPDGYKPVYKLSVVLVIENDLPVFVRRR